MVVEVMGRHAGWIALYGGLGGGADIILIPEIPFDYEKIAATVRRREREGCRSTLVVVAEGAHGGKAKPVVHATGPGQFRLGGIGEIVAREITRRTGKEARVCVLGHLQRGGAPTTVDRILGTRFGVHAVQLVREQKFGRMVSLQNHQITDVPIADAVNRLRLVSPDCEMVRAARAVEISFGD
jgi:6-phosphofructokinase 1